MTPYRELIERIGPITEYYDDRLILKNGYIAMCDETQLLAFAPHEEGILCATLDGTTLVWKASSIEIYQKVNFGWEM